MLEKILACARPSGGSESEIQTASTPGIAANRSDKDLQKTARCAGLG
jgi:hypothetical protein